MSRGQRDQLELLGCLVDSVMMVALELAAARRQELLLHGAGRNQLDRAASLAVAADLQMHQFLWCGSIPTAETWSDGNYGKPYGI